MKNYSHHGSPMQFTAPEGGVTAGTPVLIGSLLVVPIITAAEGAKFSAAVGGVLNPAPKTDGEEWTEGQKVYWKVSTAKFTTVSTDGQLAGVAAEDAASDDEIGSVRLNGVAPDTAEGPQGAIASLTGAGGGTADGALEDEGEVTTAGGNTYTDAAVNLVTNKLANNIAELDAKQEAILVALRAAGIIAT